MFWKRCKDCGSLEWKKNIKDGRCDICLRYKKDSKRVREIYTSELKSLRNATRVQETTSADQDDSVDTLTTIVAANAVSDLLLNSVSDSLTDSSDFSGDGGDFGGGGADSSW